MECEAKGWFSFSTRPSHGYNNIGATVSISHVPVLGWDYLKLRQFSPFDGANATCYLSEVRLPSKHRFTILMSFTCSLQMPSTSWVPTRPTHLQFLSTMPPRNPGQRKMWRRETSIRRHSMLSSIMTPMISVRKFNWSQQICLTNVYIFRCILGW